MDGLGTVELNLTRMSAPPALHRLAALLSGPCGCYTENMILELADIRIQPGQQAAFEEAIERGLSTVAVRAKGFQGAKVNRGIENPERYVLQIFWDTLEDHTVGFRESPLFAEWRGIVGPFFAAPPVVEHFELAFKSA
jgi:heme-degrading monooxygenase HmoA